MLVLENYLGKSFFFIVLGFYFQSALGNCSSKEPQRFTGAGSERSIWRSVPGKLGRGPTQSSLLQVCPLCTLSTFQSHLIFTVLRKKSFTYIPSFKVMHKTAVMDKTIKRPAEIFFYLIHKGQRSKRSVK